MGGATGLPESIGRYRIRALLGEGGMGRVYLAEQEGTDRSVALKVLRPGLYGAEARQRFHREMRVLGRLQHPGIAAVYEADSVDGGNQPYLAMEYVRGRDLMTYIREQQPDIRARLALIAQLCDALQAAHKAGVVHRDLKPANIIVTDEGTPKVLDFGLARFQDDQDSVRTTSGQFLGTPLYMSPEQAAGDAKSVDATSDVYALGVLAYQVLVDRLPYDAEGKPLPELLRMIIEEEPTPLGSLDTRLRGEIETIVQKALLKEKSRRYESAADLAADIRRHLSDEPILARPASTWYYVRKFARRHRTLVGAVAIVFVILVASLVLVVGALADVLRAEDERNTSLELLAETTDLDSRRGVWQRTLAGVEGALREGHPNELALRFRKVEAHLTLCQAAAAEAELDRIDKLSPTGSQLARAQFMRAELKLSNAAPDARKQIARALANGLEGADASYARGLLAPTAGDAVAFFEQTLALSPSHSRANAALTGLLIFLGRHEDARERIGVSELLFPDSLGIHFCRAFLTGLRGTEEQTRALALAMRDEFGKEQTDLVLAAFDFAAQAFRELEGIDPLAEDIRPEALILPLVLSLQRIDSLRRRYIKTRQDPRDLALALPLPVLVRDALAELPKAFGGLVAGQNEFALRHLRAASKRLPLAAIFYLEGLHLFGQREFREAHAAFEHAAARTALTDRLGDKPYIFATACAWELARALPEQADHWHERTRYAAQRVGDASAYAAWIVGGAALDAGDPQTARRLVTLSIRKDPTLPDPHRIRARIAYAEKSYPVAVEAINRYFLLGGTNLDMAELRRKALVEARKFVEAR